MITEAGKAGKPDAGMGAMRLPGGAVLETGWWGDRADPVLVLLHEGLGSVGLWRETPGRLAALGFSVFAYSRAGYGRSSPCALPRPADYLHREAIEVLPAVLAAAGIGEHVLVGHSDGASIAMIHAGSTPGPGLRGVVAMTPHYFVEEMCIPALQATREAYLAGGLRGRLARHHDHVDCAFHGWNDTWLSAGFRGFDLAAELGRIAVPVLQVHGAEDPYGTTAQTAYAEAHMRAPVRTLVAQAQHAPHVEAADFVLPAIAGFARDCFA